MLYAFSAFPITFEVNDYILRFLFCFSFSIKFKIPSKSAYKKFDTSPVGTTISNSNTTQTPVNTTFTGVFQFRASANKCIKRHKQRGQKGGNPFFANCPLLSAHLSNMQHFAFRILPLLKYFYKQKLKDFTMKKQETFTIRFFARKNRVSKQNYYPLFLRVTVNAKRIEISLGKSY